MAGEKYLNGKAGVVAGKVIVTDPVGDGTKPAKIAPGEGIILYVNSQLVETEREVTEKDTIEVIPRDIVEEEKLEVEISKDGFIAKARVYPKKVIRYTISDREPEQQLLIEGEPVESRENPFTVEKLREELRRRNVRAGIDENAVAELAEALDERWRIVARGCPAKEGKNGFIEYLFDLERVEVSHDNEAQKIDYRERYRIPSVAEGDVLALVHPPVPGEPGFKVTGETIEPKPVEEAVIYHREGVRLIEGGTKAVAAIAGRPLLEKGKKVYLTVTPLHVHYGDVDMKSGNLHFNGSLQVTGNINEGMLVQAQKDIIVKGRSAGAILRAGEGIVFYQNVINCRIEAGKLKTISLQLEPKLEELVDLINDTVLALNQLAETLKARGGDIEGHGLPSLLKLLLEKKFPEVSQISRDTIDMLEDVDVTIPPFLNKIKNILANLASSENVSVFNSFEQLYNLIRELEKGRERLEELRQAPADIVAPYVQNSILQTSGNININGPGCYNSVFCAGGSVNIKGVFRGGKISAVEKVVIGEAGSPNSYTTQGEVKVAADSAVYIRQVYANFKVFIGDRGYYFKDPRASVKIYLGDDGMVKTALW